MSRYPFAITVLFSLTPLPISIVRILAPAVGFPVRRYMLAQIVGRFPRFYLLAWIGHTVPIPSWILVGMFVALLVSFYLSSRAIEEDDDEDTSLEPEPGTSARMS